MPHSPLAIVGCTALVHDAAGDIQFVDDATVVVREGAIESVGSVGAGSSGDRADIERIDGRGCWRCPGSSTATRIRRW
jgi:5-methylthioadenosine/S-adenosylhomocysteine deaminase